MSTNTKDYISMENPFKEPTATEKDKKIHEAEAEENAVQGFGPSISVWEQLKKTNRTHVVVGSVIALLVGIILGAGVTAIIFTQTTKQKEDAPPITTTLSMRNMSSRQTTSDSEIDTTTPVTTTAVTTTSVEPEVTTAVAENCNIIYRGKCFHAIVKNDLDVEFDQAKKLCSDAGFQLANIYSKSHYFMIEGYLRASFPSSGYISAWTGMQIIPREGQIVLSTGQNVTLPDYIWHEGYPTTDREFTHIGLDFLRIPTASNIEKQGLWSYDPTWPSNTAICEDF